MVLFIIRLKVEVVAVLQYHSQYIFESTWQKAASKFVSSVENKPAGIIMIKAIKGITAILLMNLLFPV